MDTSVTLHVYPRDVDKLWQQATAAGAKVVMPIDNQFWGERYGSSWTRSATGGPC